MKLQTIFAVLITLVRIYLGIKVISWLIINLISQVSHPLSEIEAFLVIILLDIWVSSQISGVIVVDKEKDESGS
jgi:hypothetical protein